MQATPTTSKASAIITAPSANTVIVPREYSEEERGKIVALREVMPLTIVSYLSHINTLLPFRFCRWLCHLVCRDAAATRK
jgi:hypothetical protein